jgi:SAM-dependent methyltransferase
MNAQLENHDESELQRRYGLSYHVSYAAQAEAAVGLRGKRVLEVGGSLPRDFVLNELGAAQWVSIEELGFWDNLTTTGGASRLEARARAPAAQALAEMVPLASLTREHLRRPHLVLGGAIEDLPEAAHGQFDVIFSIAAFEHFLNMPVAVDEMYAALRPGGRLFSMFSPVWSAHDGHHLPEEIRDASGRKMGFDASPVPPWGHLLMRPPQMMRYLCGKTDRQTAACMVFHIYHSRHINRLFTEDYAAYFEASPFRIDTLGGTFPVTGCEEAVAHLRTLYPGREHFANNGILAVLTRPDRIT